MMAMPKPMRPPPEMPPSSVCVKPNWLPQSCSTKPRTEKPMPAAINVMKLDQNSSFSFFPTTSLGGGEVADGCCIEIDSDMGRTGGRRGLPSCGDGIQGRIVLSIGKCEDETE